MFQIKRKSNLRRSKLGNVEQNFNVPQNTNLGQSYNNPLLYWMQIRLIFNDVQQETCYTSKLLTLR
jgi:hypothetical protein